MTFPEVGSGLGFFPLGLMSAVCQHYCESTEWHWSVSITSCPYLVIPSQFSVFIVVLAGSGQLLLG